MVVGATDGIGLALAHEYVGRRWRVGLVGRSEQQLDRVLSGFQSGGAEPQVIGCRCDVSDSMAIGVAFGNLVSRLGGLDLLIYCAGIKLPAANMQERLAGTGPTFAVNVEGAVHFLERGARYLAETRRGRLAALGSVAGVRGRKGDPVYAASEADARRSVSCCEYSSYEIDWLDSRRLDQPRILRRLSSAFLSCPSSGRW